MDKLHQHDIVGAEQYISENGRQVTLYDTTGVHKILMKHVIDARAFDEIGYDQAKTTGQTTWVPIFSRLDPSNKNNKIVSVYIVLANRGDGWKVDDLYDPKR